MLMKNESSAGASRGVNRRTPRPVSASKAAGGLSSGVKRRVGRPRKTESAAPTSMRKVGRPKKTESAAPTGKRRVGRPKKTESAAPTGKRKVGRPKKTESAAPTGKRRVGRPKKTESAAPTGKRRVGRPKKTEAALKQTTSAAKAKKKSAGKGKVGRPKKSTSAVSKSVVTKKSSAAKNKASVLHTPVAVSKVAPKTLKVRTKTNVVNIVSEATALSRNDVKAVFAALSDLIAYDLGKKGPGAFSLLGLLKLTRVHKKATKSKKTTNPFTGEPMTVKAKPARKLVKVRPLKTLKDFV